MKRKRITAYEDEPEAPNLSIGSYDGFTEVPKNDVRKKPQIGFIRQKPKRLGSKKKK